MIQPETPAERLARAAAVLRERANAATAEIVKNPYWGAAQSYYRPETYERLYDEGVQNALGGPSGILAGTFGPDVALLVADLLSASSADWEQMDHHNATTSNGRDYPDAPDDSMEAALALADAILGEAS